VDPLAPLYKRLYQEFGVTPPVIPHECDGETLTSNLSSNYYDIVHSKNAVDHSYNAPLVIGEMVKVARPGGVVMVLVNENVAERERNWGLHQWNFEAMPMPYQRVLSHRRLPADRQPAHVFRWNNGTTATALFDIILWNKSLRLRLEDVFSMCAFIEKIEVLEGYVEYAARYLMIRIRRTEQVCT